MPYLEIVQGLLFVLFASGGYWLSRLASDVKALEKNMNSCQNDMPYKYVLKEDFKDSIDDLKSIIVAQGQKTDHLIEKLFEKMENKADK
jgi:hypothetical protein